MRWLLAGMARVVSRRPGIVLAGLGAATVVLLALGAGQDVETDITSFSAESDLTVVFDRIEDEFGGRGAAIQVIIDAGQGGNVLSADGLRLASDLTELIEDDPELAELLRAGTDRSPAVVSYAASILPQAELLGVEPAELTDVLAGAAVAAAVDAQGAGAIEGLLSDDADLDAGRARGGLIIVNLATDLSEAQADAASLVLSDLLAGRDVGWFDVEPFSFAILSADIEDGLLDDLPLLMALSFGLIIVILSVLFRSVSDVIFGVTGLILTILWMNGFAVLLGPDYLGWTGPFNQIAVAVPVLLVGLGIDYSVHLNARYQEERRSGAEAAAAAATAVTTVGVALALATATTVIGFLSNVATPLPPIADFGAFAAVGIASAFVVMGLGVPSARTLLDRRKLPPLPEVADREPSSSKAVDRIAALPARAPITVLAVAVATAGVGGLLAAGLDTSFSQEDFIPADSAAAALIDQMEELFGGDVSEQTTVFVEGDLSDPAVLNTLADVTDDLGDLDDVVTSDGAAEVSSPVAVIERLEATVEAVQLQLAGQFAFLDDPDAAIAELPLPEVLTVADLPQAFLDDATDIELDGVDLDDLAERLPAGTSPVAALLGTLPGAELADTLREGAADGAVEERPAGVTDGMIAELAALEAEEIDRSRLEAAGWPADELPSDALGLLDSGARLAELGWSDGRLTADADVDAIYAEVAEHARGDLDAVLAADRNAGLVIVSTQAGETGAEALAAALDERFTPLADVGVTGTVASEQLVVLETLDELTGAQINAIVISLAAATLLLAFYYGLSARRPMLGVVTMLPSLLAVPLILGSMRVAGLSFNALTATVASIAVGIGVPYGIHLTNRYLEQRTRSGTPAEVAFETIRNTGVALVGSAVTTASGFGVLVFSGLVPIRQFGGVTSVTIVYALLAAVFAETAGLVLWDRYHRWRGRHPDLEAAGQPAPFTGETLDGHRNGSAPSMQPAEIGAGQEVRA